MALFLASDAAAMCRGYSPLKPLSLRLPNSDGTPCGLLSGKRTSDHSRGTPGTVRSDTGPLGPVSWALDKDMVPRLPHSPSLLRRSRGEAGDDLLDRRDRPSSSR